MRRINLSIPEALWVDVQARATAEKVSGSEWIRQAVYARLTMERVLEGDPLTLRALDLAKSRDPDEPA